MTQREQFELDETKRYIYARDGMMCRVCGKHANLYSTPQLAHLIPQTKANKRKYGDILHHPDNLWLTCCLDCNNKAELHYTKWEEKAEVIRGNIRVYCSN